MCQECSEAAPSVPERRGTTWSEPALYPPSQIGLRLDISVDGPAGFSTVAIVVHNQDGAELAAMECAPCVRFDQTLAIATSMLAEQLATALSVISPF